jgi:hypothetical protein
MLLSQYLVSTRKVPYMECKSKHAALLVGGRRTTDAMPHNCHGTQSLKPSPKNPSTVLLSYCMLRATSMWERRRRRKRVQQAWKAITLSWPWIALGPRPSKTKKGSNWKKKEEDRDGWRSKVHDLLGMAIRVRVPDTRWISDLTGTDMGTIFYPWVAPVTDLNWDGYETGIFFYSCVTRRVPDTLLPL